MPSAVAAAAATASAYPTGVRTALLVVLLISAAVWIGGWVIAIVVARTATATLTGPDRVAFFRTFGRRYGIVTTVFLVTGLASGLTLLLGMAWTASSTWMVALSVAMVLVLASGVVQARAQTRRRQTLAQNPDDHALSARITRSATVATWIRAAIGLLSIAVLVVAVIRMA